MPTIHPITLPTPGLDSLLAEATAEGYDFVSTLIEDWTTGTNRFDAPGEALWGCFDNGQLIAVGGLNIDPFEANPRIGRIRRVYVRSAWRNQGIGHALITALLDESRKTFHAVRLRAENSGAARLYERMGFLPIDSPDATHILHFNLPE